jgi:hypothetical protein
VFGKQKVLCPSKQNPARAWRPWDEANPAALRRQTPEAQDPLLAEYEGVLLRHLLKAHDAGSAHQSAENETNSSVRLV